MITLEEYLELDSHSPWYSKYYEELGLPDSRREEDKALIMEYNKALIEKYPWLLPRNRWTGNAVKDFDYSHTELDALPEGWRIAFGDQMCEEIQQALIKAQERNPEGGYEESWITTNYDSDKILPYVEGFRITEIKEKYGALRFYCGGAPEEVHSIISKYEELSATTCIDCGQPAKWTSIGWISPYCDDCKNRLEANEDFRDDFREL